MPADKTFQTAGRQRPGRSRKPRPSAAVPDPEPATHLLTAEQLAEFLQVTRRTVLRLAAREEIPSIRIGNRLLRFERDAVLRALTDGGTDRAVTDDTTQGTSRGIPPRF